MFEPLRFAFVGFVAAIGLSLLAADARAQNAANSSLPANSAGAGQPELTALAVQGEYAAPGLGLQVVAVGNDEFEFALYAGGLPGAGWDRSPPQRADGDADTIATLVASRKLTRVERRSPTLGAKPPAGAVVLFDGSAASLANWQTGAQRTDDGLLQPGATTKQTFRDYTLHAEFQTPFRPAASGQARGNSGIYHQGRYETQILDSFGLEGKNNEAGGIYEVRDPDLNMCFPPLRWQTYDVDFTAARFDDGGKKIADAKLTVRLNGVVVQRDVRVPRATRAAPLPESPEPGPIYLQDHGNPVRFRNIWLVPRDADREALSPKIPGFERFFAAANSDAGENSLASDALGGRLLIARLGCAACHATDDPSLAADGAPVLSEVGSRVRLDHLISFVGKPHQTKPGTTMPDVLHHLNREQRAQRVAELASWLATTGKPIDRPGDSAAIERGEKAFHTIGCVACHAPRSGEAIGESTSVPLGDLTAKYTLDALSQFLINPHAVRPSGAMPRLITSLTEARDVACYLLGPAIVAPAAEQFHTSVYYGSWQSLPDLDQLQPAKTGSTVGLDLDFAGRKEDFAMRFEAYLPIQVAGRYVFYLGSDDGSRLLIDGQEVIKFDGIHPFSFRRGQKRLEAGMHRIRIDYFEGGGQERLELEMEGPGAGRSPAALWVTSSEKPDALKPLIADSFQPVASLAAEGKRTFQSAGCANCHALKIGDETVASNLKAPPLSSLRRESGCLAEKVPAGAVDFALHPRQRAAIVAALTSLASDTSLQSKASLDEQQRLHLELAGKNCYACHNRGAIGGPEPSRDSLFATRMPEMGNEGRLPPPLTGVGDKLKPEVIAAIIADGAKDRPYMLTRMPGFGKEATGQLADLLVQLDARQSPTKGASAARTDSQESEAARRQMIADGRKLVGSGGLACIKCHTFGEKATPGIQAIDMLSMPSRLREDWFHRYMLNPAELRPGTRMPASFPEGKSVLTDVLGGDADAQIRAIWTYLSEGKRAKPPAGLDSQSIVLAADARPVIYRNFIEGLSPRGIAVGYPERVNLAWDAGQMSLALLWKNDFIDAGKHWTGRGAGFQGPLGDFVIKLDATIPVARLESPDAAWPTAIARAAGAKFRGYRLDTDGRPIFRYSLSGVEVEDYPRPAKEPATGRWGFERRLTINSSAMDSGSTNNAAPRSGLMARLAKGKIVPAGPNTFTVDSQLTVRVEGGQPRIHEAGDGQELRIALPDSGQATITTWLWW